MLPLKDGQEAAELGSPYPIGRGKPLEIRHREESMLGETPYHSRKPRLRVV
jgi:hypothetical protein